MKIRIAKTILKQNSPELDNVFSKLIIQSKEDFGEIVEYTVPGDSEDKDYFYNGINLSEPGALLPGDGVELSEEEKQPKPEKNGSLSIDVGKASTITEAKDITIKSKGRPAKIYVVTKGNKIMDIAGNFLAVGTEFKKTEIQKSRSIKNMINWGWCIEQ